MSYQAREYTHLSSSLGISDNLITNHFSLYTGYVKNTNLILESITNVPKESVEYGELRRRFGWEFNGMRLHELYFESLTTTPQPLENFPDIFNKIQSDFGSLNKWTEEFRAICSMRGIGWAVLYHDRWADRFFNVWVNEHNTGNLVGCRPLVTIDMFEHAYLPDNIRKPDYISSMLNAVDWSSADQRLKALA